jgi:hypothetical protein
MSTISLADGSFKTAREIVVGDSVLCRRSVDNATVSRCKVRFTHFWPLTETQPFIKLSAEGALYELTLTADHYVLQTASNESLVNAISATHLMTSDGIARPVTNSSWVLTSGATFFLDDPSALLVVNDFLVAQYVNRTGTSTVSEVLVMMGLLGTLYEVCDTDPSLCAQLQTLPEMDKKSAVDRVREYADRCAKGNCETSQLLQTFPDSVSSVMTQPRMINTSCYQGNATLAQATQICTVVQVEATRRSRANGCQIGCVLGIAVGTVVAVVFVALAVLVLLSRRRRGNEVVELSKGTAVEVAGQDEPAEAARPKLSM